MLASHLDQTSFRIRHVGSKQPDASVSFCDNFSSMEDIRVAFIARRDSLCCFTVRAQLRGTRAVRQLAGLCIRRAVGGTRVEQPVHVKQCKLDLRARVAAGGDGEVGAWRAVRRVAFEEGGVCGRLDPSGSVDSRGQAVGSVPETV